MSAEDNKKAKDGDIALRMDFYGDYSDVHIQEETPKTPYKAPAELNESDRLLEFFRGQSNFESEIILTGLCPKCFKEGQSREWTMVGIGFKQCLSCGWKDH